MESHEELRPYLFSIAYRMLGSVAEAEDVVQDTFLGDVEPESPKAYLATVTTRLAIDQLRSARSRREVYPGEWLPEPLVGDQAVRHAETADSLSLAFLHLLEKLAPVERAVFLLPEVFDYPYDEIAPIVGKSPENCRQILARAHRHVEEGRRRFEVSREERDEVAGRFLAAWEEGDTDGLVAVLAADATVYGDGGGKAPSVPEPLVGAERVAKALIGWGRQARSHGYDYRPAVVQPGPGRGLLRSGGHGDLGGGAGHRRGRRRGSQVGSEPRQAHARSRALGDFTAPGPPPASRPAPPPPGQCRPPAARIRAGRWRSEGNADRLRRPRPAFHLVRPS
jgi:RNA polymerase sigma-70 factor (ECF subfamily)